MFSGKRMAELKNGERESLYCPACQAEVADPLVCGDCGAVICRRCGTPLEKIDELGIG
jgi:methionyl-tRNA synthetase